MGFDGALDEKRRFVGVDTGGDPVLDQRPPQPAEVEFVLVTGRERVPVGDEKVAVVLVL